MTFSPKWIAALFAFALAALGCTPKPMLVKNETYEFDGPEAAQEQVEACTVQAAQDLQDWTVAPEAPAGNVPGSKTEALRGAVIGGVISGGSHSVAGGAIQGATIAGGRRVNKATGKPIPDEEVRRDFVKACLADNGYEIKAWDG